MIGQISPLVEGDAHKLTVTGFHVTGGFIGGVLTGVAVSVFAALVQIAMTLDVLKVAVGIGLVGLSLAASASDLGSTLVPKLSAVRQTPQGWLCALGRDEACLLWGMDLGTGVTTRVHVQVFWVLPAYLLALGDLPVAVLAFSVFGAVRTGVACLIAHRLRAKALDRAFDFIAAHDTNWRIAGGLAGIGLSIYFASQLIY